MILKNNTADGLAIIVLTRNRRELLRGCLESLFAQDHPGIPMEIIVVDDGSTDGTGNMVRGLTTSRPQLKYITQAHHGIAAARNAGIRDSHSALIAIVADDYLLAPDYAASIVTFFRERPQAQVVRFKVVAADDNYMSRVLHAYQEASVRRRLAGRLAAAGRRNLWQRWPDVEKIITDHDLEAAGGAAFRSDVFRRVGLFDESFSRGEDSELSKRLHDSGIALYYSPFQRIRHRYDPDLRTAMKNAFVSGRASWRLNARPGLKPVRMSTVIRIGFRSALAALYWSCWRAWQSGWTRGFFLYLPVLLLIETANRAGYFSECLRARRSAFAASGGHDCP